MSIILFSEVMIHEEDLVSVQDEQDEYRVGVSCPESEND